MSKEFYPERLSWIRKKRGLTKSAIAKAIDVDLRSISAYEAGEFEPTEKKINDLSAVLEVLPSFFSNGLLEGPNPEQVSFRSFSKLSASKRDMALGSAAIAFLLSEWFDEKFNLPEPNIPDLRDIQDPEQAALTLRYEWGLGERPISNLVHLLESKGVRIFTLALKISDVDACCTWHNELPFIFQNTMKSNARRRFDIAHELGHLVMHRHGEYDVKASEKEADDFASAFLMPRSGFASTAPRLPDLKNIIINKKNWGVSVAAYTVRLYKLKLISEWQYRTLFKQISYRGYRKKEPYDHPKEMSQIADFTLKELRKDGISLYDIANSIGVSTKDITDLLFDIAIFGLDGDSSINRINNVTNQHLRLAIDNTN
jgi:Zn-dependent peptidase ImmA (M78 family)/DNA-binding XRE family transcriptional regulator